MEKQKPLTVVTGFSLKDKCDVIRRMQGNKQTNIRVILFRPTDVKLVIHSEDPFPLTHFISEAVHHVEINTIPNLITALEEESCNHHFDEIILDIYPISHQHSLFESLTSQNGNQNWFIKSHIHVIDARDFWFSYYSEHGITICEFDSNLTLEYTIGETLINQLELAEMIFLSNTEQLSHERLGELMVFIQNLQPQALVSNLNDMNWRNEDKKTAFDMKAAYNLYADQTNLFSSRSNMKVIGQYGIETFVYQSFLPVDFSRLEQFFTKLPSEVFRMKGRCYNPFTQELHSISQVGSSIQVDTTNIYSAKSTNALTELLFIGSELNHEEIETMLNDCLQIKYDRIAY
ncbi:GTP-binding protein [Alkalihalobacillus deserti]|uniref:GTP-binding protein n=1 Tax=Alkalihalobacillus deserti TaxID=2879466 RepID=UPI001D15D9B5|nr:GTP-binding protein [Alkalihalobacillus deserti]